MIALALIEPYCVEHIEMKFRAIKRRIYARLGNPSNHDFFRGYKIERNRVTGWLRQDGKIVGRIILDPPGTPKVKRRDRFYREAPFLQFSMAEFGMENLSAAMGIRRA